VIVATTADENYALPLRVALRSLVDFHPEADLHVLDCGLTTASMKKTEQVLGREVFWHEVPKDILPPLEPNPVLSNATYARLALHLLLPRTPKVLYLDADTLTVGELDELWSTPLSGDMPIAAVSDTGELTLAQKAVMPKVTTYFNAGVFMADLAEWRREQVHAWYPSLIGKAGPFHDQCILNTIFDNRVTVLDTKWNWQRHEGGPAPEDTRIIHYVGHGKPWYPRRNPRPDHAKYHKVVARVC